MASVVLELTPPPPCCRGLCAAASPPPPSAKIPWKVVFTVTVMSSVLGSATYAIRNRKPAPQTDGTDGGSASSRESAVTAGSTFTEDELKQTLMAAKLIGKQPGYSKRLRYVAEGATVTSGSRVWNGWWEAVCRAVPLSARMFAPALMSSV